MTIYLSLLISLVGLIIYLAVRPDNPKPMEVGRIMFFAGLLAFLLRLSETALQIMR
jgi:hypothetical protein